MAISVAPAMLLEITDKPITYFRRYNLVLNLRWIHLLKILILAIILSYKTRFIEFFSYNIVYVHQEHSPILQIFHIHFLNKTPLLENPLFLNE